MSLQQLNNRVVQRTSANTGKLRTETERAAFSTNVRYDLANIIALVNNVYFPLLNTLQEDAIDGLEGRTIYTDLSATAESASVYWDANLSRIKTIREGFDTLLSEIARLENLISSISSEEERDTIALEQADEVLEANLTQLAIDTFGGSYTLDGDGAANQTNPLADLVTALSTYAGVDTPLQTEPDYSQFGALTYLTDGQSLTAALQLLDETIANTTPVFTDKQVLFGNGTNVPVTDSMLNWDATNNRLGIGTAAPEKSLDVRGVIQHTDGVVSRGGDARGTGASDLQVTRSSSDQVASGTCSSILGGQNNKASGNYSTVSGNTCVASGASSRAGGNESTASGSHSVAEGFGAVATLHGERASAAGYFSTQGDAQTSEFIARGTTTNATPSELFLDGSSTRLTLADNTSVSVVAYVLARTASGSTAHYKYEATIKRGTGAASTALVGSAVKTVIAEDDAAWDIQIEADNIQGCIGILATGAAATTIHWVVRLQVLKLIF